MYTILVTQENELITSVRERIMKRSKMVDKLHFLVDQFYKENIDMTDFNVMLEYVMPESREYKTELLVRSEELYKDKLEYTLPFDTKLTKEAGEIEIQLTFTKVDIDKNGNNVQYVRKTSPTTITITPISTWSDFVHDEALNAMDALALKLDGYMKQQEEIATMYQDEKADDIKLDTSTGELYLVSKNDKIGTPIALDDLSDAIADHSDEGLVTMMI